jgi:hypothetical protein
MYHQVKNTKYHTVETYPKYHTVKIYPKYHTVETYPKYHTVETYPKSSHKHMTALISNESNFYLPKKCTLNVMIFSIYLFSLP